MEDRLLGINRVVFVKDPTILPPGVPHTEAIDALANNHQVVILLSHGNKYHFPAGWILPDNVSLLEYDLDLPSITQAVYLIRDLLRQHNIEMQSRFLDNDDALPMILAGACLTVGPNTKVTFINKPEQYTTKYKNPIVTTDTDWDCF